jgi:cytochrome oxidase assembly protein ShyY1
MHMSIGGRLPTLVVLALLPLLISLGCWQLSRAEEKRVMLAQYAERRVAEPVSSAQLASMTDPSWRRVRVTGHFDPDHSLLLDNSQRDSRIGVELLQPFEDQTSGLWLLVNRGWLPWPDRRTPPTFDTPGQALNLEAWVYVLPGATFQLHADPTGAPWPRLVTAVDPAKLWAELGREGFAQQLRLAPGPAAYRLDWPVVAMGPEKHLGYAVQWFAMAATLTVLALYLGWRTRKNRKENAHGRDQQPVPRL